MALSKAQRPAQKPDPTRSKYDDIPREQGQGAPAVVHSAPQPARPDNLSRISGGVAAGDGSGRARRFSDLQRTVGNARLSRTLEESVHRKPANEERLADVYGVDEVDQAKHAAHATPDSQTQHVPMGEPPGGQSSAPPAVHKNYSEPNQGLRTDLDQQVDSSAFTGTGTVQKKDSKGAKKKPQPPATTTVGPPTRISYTVKATTLKGVVEELGTRTEAGRTDWKPHLDYKLDGRGIVTSATVTVPIPLEMPTWPAYKKARKIAQAEWDRAYRALEAHEQGHVELVHQHFDGIATSLIGKTETEATAAFKKAKDDLQAASDGYDSRTEHGEKNGTIIDLSKG